MTPISNLETLLTTLAGAILLWLGQTVNGWIKRGTAERRLRTDRAAKCEKQVRVLTESLHDHRNEMLKSGMWTRDTLPPFIKE